MFRAPAIMSLLLLTACEEHAMQQLEGRWQSSCDAAPQVSWSYDKIVTVKVNKIEVAENTYRGKNCDQLEYSTTWVSLFSVEKPQDNSVDGIFIDKTLEAYLWTEFNSDEIQSRYNDTGFCGYKDWVVNVPKDCSGKQGSDQFFPPKGSMKYNIFKVEGDIAYFGILDANVSSERETTVNYSIPFQRLK